MLRSALVCGLLVAFATAAEWEVIKLPAGVHEASSIKYWDAEIEFIEITGGRKVRIEGEGKGKTVIKGIVRVDGRKEENALELVGLTIADSQPGVIIAGKGAVGKVRQCEIRGHKGDGVRVCDGGKAELEESDIHGNARYGVVIYHEGSALGMRKCNLWDNNYGDEVEFDLGASASDSTMEGSLIGDEAKREAKAKKAAEIYALGLPADVFQKLVDNDITSLDLLRSVTADQLQRIGLSLGEAVTTLKKAKKTAGWFGSWFGSTSSAEL